MTLDIFLPRGSEFVPEVIKGYMDKNPDKKIEFGFNNGITESIIKGVKEEKYDVGFCSMAEGEKNLEFTPVSQEKLIGVVPLNHPLADKSHVEFREIAAYPQVFFNRGSGFRSVADKIFKDNGIKPEIVYTVDEDSALVGLVAKGFGVGIVPDAPTIRSMKVAFLTIDNLEYHRFIYMVTLKNKYQPPVVKEFIQYIKECFSLKK